MENPDNCKLDGKWIFWFHDPSDNNWDISSYKKIYEIETIKDFWNLYSRLDNYIVENSMIFLMRENIEPLWEHKENCNGGSWSLKISKSEIKEYWDRISIALLGENINKSADTKINGISLSPKKNFCILKIWNKDKSQNNLSLLNSIEGVSYDGIIYKPHN